MTLVRRFIARVSRRSADFIIGGADRPYLLRWWVIPRNRFFNIYLHRFLRSDDDRACHDHPWTNVSVLLAGQYIEHRIRNGGGTTQTLQKAGAVVLRGARAAHRIELNAGPCWTLFITGPKVRDWGFRCPQGWIPWQLFVADGDVGSVGKGCDQ